MNKNKQQIYGFTIVELLIVIVIIGILATLTAVVYSGIQAKARDASVLADLDTMDAMQTSYGLKNGVVGKEYYSGSGPDTELDFAASEGNVIDVVVNSEDYCIRGYNTQGTRTTIEDAFIKESSPGACERIVASDIATGDPDPDPGVGAQGIVSLLAGSTEGYIDGTGAGARFSYPNDIAVGPDNNIYVVDTYNNRIRKITPAGVVTTLAGSGPYGYGNRAGFVDGPGSSAQFDLPEGIGIDTSGTIYIADLWNFSIRKVSSTGVVTTLAGSDAYGSSDGTGSNARFANPADVVIDSSGVSYVVDSGSDRIRKITPAGVVTTFAGSTRGFNDGTGTNAQFNYPNSIAMDVSGNMYITDTNNNRIRKISSTGVVTTLAGSTQGYADGSGTDAKFNQPSGIAVDSSGNLYVGDFYNDRIRKITPSGVVTTLVGFSRPAGVAVGSNGILYVADYFNHRIQKIE